MHGTCPALRRLSSPVGPDGPRRRQRQPLRATRIVVVMLLGLVTPLLHAATLMVSTAGEVPLADPLSRADCMPAIGNRACITLRDAVNSATAGDTIVFAAGLETIVLRAALAFDAPGTDPVVVDGNERLRLDGNHTTRILAIAAGSSATLRDIVLENGQLDGWGDIGAGIHNSGRLTLERVALRGHFLGNEESSGAALYNTAGAFAQLDNCVLTGNHGATSGAIENAGELHMLRGTLQDNTTDALNSGGGALSNSGDASATGTVFENNDARFGGAIRNTGTLVLDGATLSGNGSFAAGRYGGAVYNDEASLTIRNSTLSDNSSGSGGALHNRLGTVEIERSTLEGNRATAAGGILNAGAGGRVTLRHSRVVANVAEPLSSDTQADGMGGGIDNATGILEVFDSEIARNSARFAGGLLNIDEARVERSTISGNITSFGGAGVYNRGTLRAENLTVSGNNGFGGAGLVNHQDVSSPGIVVLRHVTFAGNVESGGPALHNTGDIEVAGSILQACSSTPGASLLDAGGNLDPDGGCGLSAANGSLPGVDAMLEPLSAEGAEVATHLPRIDSPAIDAASDCGGLDNQPLAHDARGKPRPVGSACDSGALEVQAALLTVVVVGDGQVSSDAPPLVGAPIAACSSAGGTCSALFPAEFGLGVALQLQAGTGQHAIALGGSCGGTLDGITYIAGPLQQDCEVLVTFATADPVVVSLGTPAPALDAPESDGGTRTVTLPLRLDRAAGNDVVVGYTLTPASGSSGTLADDIAGAASGSVVIATGQTAATLEIAVRADATVEPDEAFGLHFSVASSLPPTHAAPNAVLDATLATGITLVLRNDDDANLVWNAPAIAEDAAAPRLLFLASLDAPVQGGFSLSYATRDVDATAASDYTARNGTLHHGGGIAQTLAILVFVLDDTSPEHDETVAIDFTGLACNFTPCPVAVPPAIGTIIDNDRSPGGLGLTLDNGTRTTDPGDLVRYVLQVFNDGSFDAAAVPLALPLPPTLRDALWSCTASGGAACDEDAGVGAITVSADVPAGAMLTYTLDAVAEAFAPTLDVTATLTPPVDFPDDGPGNDSATDSDLRRTLFRASFED